MQSENHLTGGIRKGRPKGKHHPRIIKIFSFDCINIDNFNLYLHDDFYAFRINHIDTSLLMTERLIHQNVSWSIVVKVAKFNIPL